MGWKMKEAQREEKERERVSENTLSSI